MGQDFIEILRKLVSFDTTPLNSNLELVHYIKEYLERHGVESRLVFNDKKDKAALYALIGPRVAGGIMLSGHTDVVPVAGQKWDSDPFVLTPANGRLYGRGSVDMKGFLAAVLSVVPDMCRAKLKRPIGLAFSFDEETTFEGGHLLAKEIARSLPPFAGAIIGEPTLMEVINTHKGAMVGKTRITGKEAHSSQVGKGVSAVMIGGKLINFINDLTEENMRHPVKDSPLNPPVSSIHVGIVHGGTAVNIMSRTCEFDWHLRTMPGEDPWDFIKTFNNYCAAEVLPAMHAISPECDIVTQVIADAPPLDADHNGKLTDLALTLLGQGHVQAVSYATEAGIFQNIGIPAIVCGPGSIDQAHKENEYIEIEQLDRCIDFLEKLVSDMES